MPSRKKHIGVCEAANDGELSCGCVQATADLYNRLGLPEYEAMEAFVRYDPHKPSHLFKGGAADHTAPVAV